MGNVIVNYINYNYFGICCQQFQFEIQQKRVWNFNKDQSDTTRDKFNLEFKFQFYQS